MVAVAAGGWFELQQGVGRSCIRWLVGVAADGWSCSRGLVGVAAGGWL